MNIYFFAQIIQLIGMVVPLVGCVTLFRKEDSKESMSLMLTNMGCLIINGGYLLLINAKTEEAAFVALKIEYLGNAVFYFSFVLFLTVYLKLQCEKALNVFFFLWFVMEGILIGTLWCNDPSQMVFESLHFSWEQGVRFTYMELVPGVIYITRYCIVCVILFFSLIYTTIKLFSVKIPSDRENLGKVAGAEFVVCVSLIITLVFRPRYDIVPLFAAFSIFSIIISVIKGEFFSVTDQGREWVIEHSDNVFIITDSMYGYLDCNPYAKEIFPEIRKLSRHEILPKDIKALFLDEESNFELKGRHYTKKVASVGTNGEVEGYSLLLLDISQQCELMKQLEIEKERAEDANEAKSAFMSNMSHEIRTPMNAIVGMTEILLREDLPPHDREYLTNIKSSGNALLTIINDILDFSKIESGKMEIIKDEYEPMSMFHDVAMIFLNRIGEKDVELLYNIDTELPMKLLGDSQRIRQVLINLMNNAIKFTEHGYVKLLLETKMVSEEEIELAFSIQDTGQGIREEDIDKLFGSFQQVDKKKNHYKEGTGLGLSISKQLVELMGGTIGVQSEYEKGSTFYFTIRQKVCSAKKAADIKIHPADGIITSARFKNELLYQQYKNLTEKYQVTDAPLEQALNDERRIEVFFTDDVALVSAEERRQLEAQKTTFCILQNPMQQNLSDEKATLVNKPLYSLNFCQVINHETISSEEEKEDDLHFIAPDAKILVVDDNEMNRKVVRGLLEPLKLQIDTAENGKRAVEMIQRKRYDLVFMDHMMPIMDGIEATKIVRGFSEEYYKNLPIVALSANATMEAREMFRNNGMNDFVAKPIKMKEICKCIRTWLSEDLIIYNEAGAVTEGGQESAAAEELPIIEGLNVEEGIANSGSKDLFLRLLGDFYKLIDQKSTKIEKCLADGMIRDYTIEVHALKSTARMIGAMELSEKFYHLEQLGNAEEQELLEKETPEVLALYRSYKPILEVYGRMQEQEKQSVPIEEMIQTLERLRDAMDGFDLDGADAAMKEIESYAFPEEYQTKIETLSAYVADVAMEDVITLTEQLIEGIRRM